MAAAAASTHKEAIAIPATAGADDSEAVEFVQVLEPRRTAASDILLDFSVAIRRKWLTVFERAAPVSNRLAR